MALRSRSSNQEIYFKTISETENYIEEDIYDTKDNLIGNCVSQEATDELSNNGFVRIFGYY